MSDKLEITIGENEIEFIVEIDSHVVDNGFSHEFGHEQCLELEWDNVLSLEMVTNSKFTGLNKYTRKPEYDITKVDIKFYELRDSNQELIVTAINEHLEGIDVQEYIRDERDAACDGDF